MLNGDIIGDTGDVLIQHRFYRQVCWFIHPLLRVIS